MRAARSRAVQRKHDADAPVQARSSPASASSARRCPSRHPPAPAPCSPTRLPCRSAGATAFHARSRGAPPVSVTFHPTSSMFSRISSPRCGGFSIGPTRSLAMSFMISAPLRSVVVDQVHVHGFAVPRSGTPRASCRRRERSIAPHGRPFRGCSRKPGESASCGCAASCRRSRIRRSRGTRPAGSRAGSSPLVQRPQSLVPDPHDSL